MLTMENIFGRYAGILKKFFVAEEVLNESNVMAFIFNYDKKCKIIPFKDGYIMELSQKNLQGEYQRFHESFHSDTDSLLNEFERKTGILLTAF